MRDARLPKNLFVVIVFVALAKAAYDYPLLPDRLASHFGASGFPNGWMTKPAFFTIYVALVAFAAAAVFLAPRHIAASSRDKIRLPNKEYWLAAERRPETMAYFRAQFAWYGCAFLLTEVLAMELAIEANFHVPPRLPMGPMLLVVVGFVLFNGFWTVLLIRHFSNPGG